MSTDAQSDTDMTLQFVDTGDPELRAARPLADVTDAVSKPGQRIPQILRQLVRAYGDRPALGSRARELVCDPATGRTSTRLLPRFETTTYRELGAAADAIASAWQHDPASIRPGDFIATIGFSSTEYVALDLACRLVGAVVVPLQHNATATQIRSILEETKPRLLAASAESLAVAVSAASELQELSTVVVFDYTPEIDDHRDTLAAARDRLRVGTTVELLTDVIGRGGRLPGPTPYLAVDDQELSMILYTSGSTGTPKGAMFTERMVIHSIWNAGLTVGGGELPTIGVGFLPMNHLAGRISVSATLATGGTGYFAAASDLSTLFEDWRLVRPSMLSLVPRVVDMLFQHHQTRVDALIAQGADGDKADILAKTELRQEILGGRVLGGLLATAALSPEMKEFVESALNIHLIDHYGMTEAGGVLRDGFVMRPPVIDYKLLDVPELGYYTTDKPYPRGELLVKSLLATPGYYKRPDITAEVFDADGYYRTGDVMAEIAHDHLAYVDRRNNVLKLAQGEFVAVANLESVYVRAPLVRQIYVYGNSERAHLLAVVVPTEEALQAYSGAAELKNALRESLQEAARAAELQSYELPADFLIEETPFSAESGLLSAVGKPLRPKMKGHFGPRLEQLYDDLTVARVEGLRQLRDTVEQRPIVETVTQAAQALLGMAAGAVRPGDHFVDLGGDSLSGLTFSNLLHDLFGVGVPVGVITGPAADLQSLANYIDAERSQGARRATVSSVHGTDVSTIRATDLTLDKFLDPETLRAAKYLKPVSNAIKTVLLTGANGYLGRFLCLEWLQRLSETGGTLICVVRGESTADALARLESAFSDGSTELLDEFRRLARGRLEVIPGDMAERQLGIGSQDWERLARGVDLIVHSAALVNHVLPYSQLFQPNVVGTAEVIRLALSTKLKPVNYVSTVAVSVLVPDFEEDGDVRTGSPVRLINDGYANGYANSKWAGEVLLREAHDWCGVPVSVFRSDMILAHSRYAGQLNVSDAFTRLLLSVLLTGIAPGSFYQTSATGVRPRAHYAGLPADFVAEAITTLGVGAEKGFRSYDVMNPHDDGISEDTFIDWLIEAGENLNIIDDYSEWLSRFETALRGLAEDTRRHTLLPLLDAYRAPAMPRLGAAAPTDVFRKAVQSNGIGETGDIPHLEPMLINKYLRDLRLRGIL